MKKFDEETILFKKFEFIDFEKDAQIKEILQNRLNYKIFGCVLEEINMQFKKKRLGQTDTVMKPEFGKVSVEGQYFDCRIKFLNNN